ncbi:T9SS type A sorting domain-containing protein [bacterium]|nr:T9SS type A sorting domain-containing protein [bacterium]
MRALHRRLPLAVPLATWLTALALLSASPLGAAPVPPPRLAGYPAASPPPARALGEAQRARLSALLAGEAAPRERATVRWLGILVAFQDRGFAQEYSEAFDPLNVLGFPDSVVVTPRAIWFANAMARTADYFATVSDGRVELRPTLADGVLTLSGAMAHYGDDEALSWEEGARRLAAETVDSLDATIDFSAYDLVSFIHAGPGQESDLLRNSTDQLWSGYLDFASLREAFADSLPDAPVAGWPGIPTNDGAFVLEHFGIAPELEVEEQLSPPFVLGTLGVNVHQLGSYLGLVSLNDLIEPRGQGAGNFDLMSSGLWNALGFVPGPPSAFNRRLVGWAEAERIEPAAATGAGLARSLPSWEQGAAGSLLQLPISEREYFLIENRNQDADGSGGFTFADANGNHVPDNGESLLDAEFDYFTTQYSASDQTPGSGLFVWRIDEEFVRLTFELDFNLINAYNEHYGVALLEADGYPDLATVSYDENAYGGDFDAFRAAGGVNALAATQTGIDAASLPSTRSAEGADSGWRLSGIGAHGPAMDLTLQWESAGWPRSEERLAERLPLGDPLAADLLADAMDAPEFAFLAAGAGGAADSLFLYVQGRAPSGELAAPARVAAIAGAPAGPLAAGDLDGDGLAELVLLCTDGRLFAWRGTGESLGGAPDAPLVTVGAASTAPLLFDRSALWSPSPRAGEQVVVVVEDLPDDGSLGYSRCRTHVFTGAGVALVIGDSAWDEPLRGLPVGEPALRLTVAPAERGYEHPAPTLAQFALALLDSSEGGSARVLSLATPPAAMAGWPATAELAIAPGSDAAVQLAAGDLDADGVDDLLVEAENQLLLWFPAGRYGGPGEGGVRFACPLVSGDALALLPAALAGDGTLAALAAGAGRLVACGPEGSAFADWLLAPAQSEPDPGFWADPARWLLLRRDDAGRDTPLLATLDGRVFAGRGDLAAGLASQFPGGDLAGSPVLADLDADGLLELRGLSGFTPVLGNTAGEDTLLTGSALRIWQLETDDPVAGGVPWSQGGGDAGRRRRLAAAAPHSPAAGTGRLLEAYAYPNPAGALVTWRVRSAAPERIAIALYDLEGQERLRLSGRTDGYSAWESESSLVGLAPGVYFFTIRAAGGDLVTGRLAILR